MATTDYATEITLTDLPDSPSQREEDCGASEGASECAPRSRKGVMFGFAATVTVGLMLASWYVGIRIVSADEGTSSRAAANSALSTAHQISPSAVATPVAPATPVASVAATLTVPSSALYLQVGALGPKQDMSFARSLEKKGFRVHVEARAGIRADADERVLIGPFSTQTEMNRARHKLQAAGVLAIETEY
jgi:cell division septation protein DedD